MDTEQEELEALQKWWNENGRQVIVGLVLGLGGVFGWTTWQSHVETTAEELSVVYQNMVDTAARDEHSKAAEQANRIIAEHPDSDYAALAGLLGAKSARAAGRAEDTKRLLGWVIENAARVELRDLARIRSARLLLDEEQQAAGLEILARVGTPAFAATVDELRGDILLEDRDTQAAAAAYTAALAGETISSAMRSRVQMKLDDLGHDDGFGRSP